MKNSIYLTCPASIGGLACLLYRCASVGHDFKYQNPGFPLELALARPPTAHCELTIRRLEVSQCGSIALASSLNAKSDPTTSG
jgi:hypothetical protein